MVRSIVGAVVMMALVGCGSNDATLGGFDEVTTQTGTRMSFEEFKARYAYWDTDRKVFIADGDTVFADEKLLREFYEMNVKEGQLIVNRVGASDDIWDTTRRQNLTYCVSNGFGTNKTAIVNAMATATQGWMAVANVKYVYVSAQDANCTATNSSVLFNVRPINANGQYIAAAFFPSDTRANRELVIDNSIFGPGLSVAGVLRHELGHTLGFRHEHTRPEAGTCFEDNQWRALTPYDSASVMHYPQCNGTNSWQLPLTQLDIQGVQAIYGAAGTTPNPTPTPTPTGTIQTFTATIAQNASKSFGPFSAKASTLFRATMTGSGDGDLYVRFGSAPTASSYNCRPYLSSSNEECRLTTPTTDTSVYVTVVGYAAATISLEVEFTPGGTTTPPPSTGTPTTATFSGSVAKGQLAAIAPLSVVAGTTFTVKMTGSGDPDLYVRFGSAPTLTSFDCRPYLNGASETCTLTVPAGQTQAYIGVNGYTAGTYSLAVNYTRP